MVALFSDECFSDFGELCIRLGLPAHGVVILSLKGLSAELQGAHVVKCLA